MTDAPSPTMLRIMSAWNAAAAGDRAGARQRYLELWDELSSIHDPADRDPAEYLTLAHFLADVQDEPTDELEWDRTALAIADGLTDDDRERWPEAADTIAGFYPSLYVNLAADHLKLGERDTAREWLTRAQSTAEILPNTEYGNMIRGAMDWVASELA